MDRSTASGLSSRTVDPPPCDTVDISDVPTVDDPAMDTGIPSGHSVSDVVDSSSLPWLPVSDTASSASTPVNPISGKRQLPASAESAPAKKDKAESDDVPSYVQYKREYQRVYALGMGATPEDRAAAIKLQQRIPEPLLCKYSFAVAFSSSNAS